MEIITAKSLDEAKVFDLSSLYECLKNELKHETLGHCAMSIIGRATDSATFSRIKGYTKSIPQKNLGIALERFSVCRKVPVYNLQYPNFDLEVSPDDTYVEIPKNKFTLLEKKLNDNIDIINLCDESVEADFIYKMGFEELKKEFASYPDSGTSLFTLALYAAICNTYAMGKIRETKKMSVPVTKPQALPEYVPEKSKNEQGDTHKLYLPCFSTLQGLDYTCPWNSYKEMVFNPKSGYYEAYADFRKGDSFKISQEGWQNVLEFRHLATSYGVLPENDNVGGCNIRIGEDGCYLVQTDKETIRCSRTGSITRVPWRIAGKFAHYPDNDWARGAVKQYMKIASSPLQREYPSKLYDCYATDTLTLEAGDELKLCVVGDNGEWTVSACARHLSPPSAAQSDFTAGDDICGANIKVINSGKYTLLLHIAKNAHSIQNALSVTWIKHTDQKCKEV